MFSRAGDLWTRRELIGDDPMTFPAIGVTMPLSEAYSLIRFPTQTG
jgi:hypothetical protein